MGSGRKCCSPVDRSRCWRSSGAGEAERESRTRGDGCAELIEEREWDWVGRAIAGLLIKSISSVLRFWREWILVVVGADSRAGLVALVLCRLAVRVSAVNVV